MSEIADLNKLLERAFDKSFDGDFGCLKDIKHLAGRRDTNWIYSVAHWAFIANLRVARKNTEQQVYEWFKEHYKDILGNEYEIVKYRNKQRHIPDFWLKYEDEYIPVECKRGAFDKKALEQLKRYITVYETERGIAVARELKCTLPSNIRYIEVSA